MSGELMGGGNGAARPPGGGRGAGGGGEATGGGAAIGAGGFMTGGIAVGGGAAGAGGLVGGSAVWGSDKKAKEGIKNMRERNPFLSGMNQGRREGQRMAGKIFGGLIGASPLGIVASALKGGRRGGRPKPDRGPWGGGRSGSEDYPYRHLETRGPRRDRERGGGQRGQWINNETGDAWVGKGRGDLQPGRRSGRGDKPEDWSDDPRLKQYTFKPKYRK